MWSITLDKYVVTVEFREGERYWQRVTHCETLKEAEKTYEEEAKFGNDNYDTNKEDTWAPCWSENFKSHIWFNSKEDRLKNFYRVGIGEIRESERDIVYTRKEK